jgi:CRISPR-associated protein Cas2
MLYLVCFDIVDDRDRYKAVRVLKEYGGRVQKSVFECENMTEEQLLKMKYRLEAVVDGVQDSIRYYALCRDCLKKFEISGFGRVPRPENFKVV